MSSILGERERSQWTVRWARSARAAIDGATRNTLPCGVQLMLHPCLPGEAYPTSLMWDATPARGRVRAEPGIMRVF